MNVNFEIKAESLALAQTATIDANFAETEAALREMMLPYKTMVLTDVATAKTARAEANRVKKSIDDARKTVKKLWNAPLAAFEDRCKVLTGICDEAAGAIDAQIKAEEQKEKDIRVETLRNYFNSSAHGLEDYITFERIFNPKWETKSYGMANAEAEIDRAIETTAANVEAIRAMHSPFETTLLLVLQETGDMSKVLRKKAACEELEAHKAARAAEREEYEVQAIGTEEPPAAEPEPPVDIADRRMFTFTLEFTCTRDQAFMIDKFFKDNNIKFRKVR